MGKRNNWKELAFAGLSILENVAYIKSTGFCWCNFSKGTDCKSEKCCVDANAYISSFSPAVRLSYSKHKAKKSLK